MGPPRGGRGGDSSYRHVDRRAAESAAGAGRFHPGADARGSPSGCWATQFERLRSSVVSKLTDVPKRILIGRALRSDRLGETLLPKRIALPVFASDPLSSVAYAPGEVLLVLSIAGVSAYHFSPWIALAVVVLMFTVVASYRQNVHAYPSGGGDYEVATTNLGPKAGLTVASALLVDYVLTVAVSIASGIENLGSADPVRRRAQGALRGRHDRAADADEPARRQGVRASSSRSRPTSSSRGVFIMIAWGAFRGLVLGDTMQAPTADYHDQGRAPGPGRLRPGLPAAARLLLRLRRAHRRRGHQQRRPRLPQAQEQERGDHARRDGPARRHHVLRHHRPGHGHRRQDGREPGQRPAAQRRRGRHRLRPEPGDLPGRRGRLRQRQLPVHRARRRHRAGALPGREHRVQRLPAARLDPRPGPLPAAPAAHPRRPARLLQRHRAAGRRGDPAGRASTAPTRPG